MSPLFMETGYEPNSPGSISTEDCNSHTAGSEREGDGPPVGSTGTQRREKNRDAARKSRKKQTERADVLHEELQRLERSNSSLHKEIAALKKDLHQYTTALERHEPHCCLKVSSPSSSSPTCRSASPSVGGWASSSPSRAPSQASNSTLLGVSSLSTSLNSSLGLETLDNVENAHITPLKSATTLPSASTDLFITSSSNSATVPCSVSLPKLPAPHSLFSVQPAVTSRLTGVTPVSTGAVSNPVPFSALGASAHPESEHDTFHKTSSLSADACFSALCPDTLDAFLTKETSFMPASSNAVPSFSHVPTESVRLAQCSGVIPNLYGGNLNNSRPLCPLLPMTLHDSAPQSYPVSPRASSPAFPSKSSYSQQMPPVPLLSLLTVPSPFQIPQTTSSGSDDHVDQSPPSLPVLLDSSRDLSLSELLEVNDWILGGTNNQ